MVSKGIKGVKMRRIDDCLKKSACTGCCACLNICKHNAIIMEEDEEGFRYPRLNENECIKCGMCEKVCPALNEDILKESFENGKKFISFAKSDKDKMKGSSGGIFPLLAEKMIEEKGVVYGAVFNYKNKMVEHVASEQPEKDGVFRSKYVQSYIGMSYKKVEAQLKKGTPVLFCGTPCQIIGLKMYLKKEYSNLYTIDFRCHGVPSPLIFKEMLALNEEKERSPIIHCSFREKDNGWRNQVIKLYFQNGSIRFFRSKFHFYYNLFIENYILRESCYKCDYGNQHQSDITLADAWEFINNDTGISEVICNNTKGIELFKKVSNRVDNIQECNYDNESGASTHDYDIKRRRSFFFRYKRLRNHKLLFNYFNAYILFQRIRKILKR